MERGIGPAGGELMNAVRVRALVGRNVRRLRTSGGSGDWRGGSAFHPWWWLPRAPCSGGDH
jgi:hypothetical protein